MEALKEIDARIYVDPSTPALPFAADARSLRSMEIVNTLTRLGRLDIVWQPRGSDRYGELHSDAVETEVLGQTVAVASLDALIRNQRSSASLEGP